MATIMIKRDDGTTTVLFQNVSNDITADNIILLGGGGATETKTNAIAVKIWMPEDVANQLAAMGIEPTDENVALVINSGQLDTLGDCTDQDWGIINQTIRDVFPNAREMDDDECE